jgi:hypothetical protein
MNKLIKFYFDEKKINQIFIYYYYENLKFIYNE